jgi:hypothetical protein
VLEEFAKMGHRVLENHAMNLQSVQAMVFVELKLSHLALLRYVVLQAKLFAQAKALQFLFALVNRLELAAPCFSQMFMGALTN